MRISMTGVLDLEYDAPDHMAETVKLELQQQFEATKGVDPFGRGSPLKVVICVHGNIPYTATVLGFKLDPTVAVEVETD